MRTVAEIEPCKLRQCLRHLNRGTENEWNQEESNVTLTDGALGILTEQM